MPALTSITAVSRWKTAAVFLAGMVLPLMFAFYTNHEWEDWYITYRASKNLALGNGLVFTVGERVHSFTSPLNTLIPALLSYCTGNRSDAMVIWLYRIISCALMGCSSVMLYGIARAVGMTIPAGMLLLGLFTVDARIVDFTINGMETAFMVFFMTAFIYLINCPGRWYRLKTGLCWGGLMWTRPDAFYYFGGLAIGFLLFNLPSPHFKNRREMLKGFVGAGFVCALVYLPWLIWAWSYYGSPVPHTATAKWLLVPPPYTDLVSNLLLFPVRAIFSFTSVTNTFMPPYYAFGGWPTWMMIAAHCLAAVCAFYWCLPSASPLGRAASLSLFFSHFCLTYLTPTYAPWYVPNVTFLSIVVLGLMTDQAMKAAQASPTAVTSSRSWPGLLVKGAGSLLFIASLTVTVLVAYEFKLQQEVVETGNRTVVGQWLRDNAAPRDRVFIESVGRVAYYSQLKMFDFPGLTSPEVVAARLKLQTDDYAPLIQELQPEWLVLRPDETAKVQAQSPTLLSVAYHQAKIFDVSTKVDSYGFIPGKPYLQCDQTFIVFRRSNR